jgi:hypothetical protein
MTFQIEFFRRTTGDPHGQPLGDRLEGFSSRRAARMIAERHHPQKADGFRIYKDGALLISIDLTGGSRAEEPSRPARG